MDFLVWFIRVMMCYFKSFWYNSVKFNDVCNIVNKGKRFFCMYKFNSWCIISCKYCCFSYVV